MTSTNAQQETRESLQQAARTAWRLKGRRGTLAAATGTGKTKPAIDEMMELWRAWKVTERAPGAFGATHDQPAPTFFVAVPTEQLRDVDWIEEVKKHYGDEGMEMWTACVTAVCYISMHKYRGGYYTLFIGDEFHHITVLSSQFFKANVVLATFCLTATVPDPTREPVKYELIKEYAPVVFTYPLDQGVEEGIVSGYEINVVLSMLDDKAKVIPAGNAKKRFFQTEKAAYEFKTKQLKGMQIQLGTGVGDQAKLAKALEFMQLARRRFIAELPSKEALLKAVMAKEIKPGMRGLVFAGSIDQCNRIMGASLTESSKGTVYGPVYHSKSTNYGLDALRAGALDVLGCVSALNEGVNLPSLDFGIIAQLDSNPRTFTQRVGRLVRYREGHTARIWVIVVQGTVDEEWMVRALEPFDKKRIKYLTAKSYMT